MLVLRYLRTRQTRDGNTAIPSQSVLHLSFLTGMLERLNRMKTNSNKELSLKLNMIWNSFGSLTYLGCQWLITVLVVRLTNSYDVAGTLSLAMSVYNTFASLAIYRMYTYQVSDIQHENSVGEYFTFRILTCFGALICIVCYSIATCDPGALTAIIAYAVYKITSLLIDVLHGLDQQNRRMDIVGKSLVMQGVLSLLIFCIAQRLLDNLVITLVLMTAGIAIIGIGFDLPRSSQFETMKIGISRQKACYLLRYCFPIVVGAVACGAAPSLPRQILSNIEGTTALGIYASVAAPVTIIQMGASYIYNPLLGYFSEAKAEKDLRRLTTLLIKASAGIAALGLIAAAVLGFIGEPLLTLMYGSSIAPYTYLLLPAIACSMITAYVWFLNDVLVALRQFSGSFIGNICAAILSIPAAYALIPIFGMNGVSFANIASYSISALVMLIALISALRKPS